MHFHLHYKRSFFFLPSLFIYEQVLGEMQSLINGFPLIYALLLLGNRDEQGFQIEMIS